MYTDTDKCFRVSICAVLIVDRYEYQLVLYTWNLKMIPGTEYQVQEVPENPLPLPTGHCFLDTVNFI